MTGKRRMAIWAGSETLPRRIHRAAVLSQAEAAPATEPPYCDSSRDQNDDRSPPVTYIIAQTCVDVLDKACIEECPVDCIYEGERMLYIHPDECVDCGACEPVCPVEAIYYEDDVPEQWKEYYKVNVDFFEDLGSPGGASKSGKIGKDHPLVAALPPQAAEE
jgi:ferredoxin